MKVLVNCVEGFVYDCLSFFWRDEEDKTQSSNSLPSFGCTCVLV